MAVIVDASVAVKWFSIEPLHEEARSLLAGSDPLVAPDIITVEVANALWVKVQRGEMDEPEARRALSAIVGDGEPELRPSPPLVLRAFELAEVLDHPVYDCVYLTLAQELDVPLVTADARFVAAAGSVTGNHVRLLGT